MKLPWRWITEFLRTDLTPQNAADRLTNGGVEAGSVARLVPDLGHVVIGEIEAIERDLGGPPGHPRVLVRVSTGRQRFQVVCGAPNCVPGVRAAFAPPGARLPGARTVAVAKIHGVESQGMLCSERELGLGEEHASGILVVGKDAPLGGDLVAYLGLDDWVLEIEITPNRPDCLSVVGVARELAALGGGKFQYPAIAVTEGGDEARALARVRVEDVELCPRYAARVITGVSVARSPAWLAARLRTVGLRPISNVVDVTNYVLWELGHPLHAFDYDTVAERTIVVRRARRGEPLTTLDGQDRALDEGILVIADPRRAIAIAGVMGGRDTEVTERTTRVLLEGAYFQPASIRRTSRGLGLATDAAYRFERGADIEALRDALDRAAQLIADVAGGAIARGVVDAYPAPRRRPAVPLRMSRPPRIGGAGSVPLLNPLSQEMSVLKADLVSGLLRALATNARRQQPTVRLFEIGKHFRRAGEGVVERRWLALALTGARADLGLYASRDPVDVYDAKGLAEHVLARLGTGATSVDAGIPDHPYFEPGRWARLVVGGEEVAVFGEVARGVQEAFGVPSPVVSAAIALDVVARLAGAPARFVPLPRHPSVQRDVALVLPLDRPAADVEQAIRAAGGPLLRTVTLFDLYTGQGVEAGARSAAWRLRLRAEDRTLTDAEVNDAYDQIVEAVRRRFGVEVRGT